MNDSFSSPDIQIVVPQGMMGPDNDYLISAILSAIGEHYSTGGEWGEKYGVLLNNEVFSMHPYCWCDGESCQWCWEEGEKGPRAPNFHYKPLDFKVEWYKYIGRDMRMNKSLSIPECAKMLSDCISVDKTSAGK